MSKIKAFCLNWIQAKQKIQKHNGFLLAEALLALMLAMITAFLLLLSITALSKSLSLDIQTEMEEFSDAAASLYS